ncbi:putative phage tail protein [Mariprofundus ferrooxydans PV-1]|uniref:Putative phage tail protein n=2 Tax=Mariprofundus ferrooxydans TaxID=314344 RepID=Q0F1S3_9PROT|nr:putative phage tail protein [Mariprofundus ferrooxydans PV-1]
MPVDQVELLIGGKMHAEWESYEIDSDFITPADAWRVGLGLVNGKIPPDVQAGAQVEVRIGGETVLVGHIDDEAQPLTRNRHSLSLSGRDSAGTLLDCSAPIFTAMQVTLAEVVAKVVRPFGYTKIRIDADETLMREKINVEPGDSAWRTLQYSAEANGLWPWFEPDGTLVIGGPDYTSPVVAELVMRRSGKGNNALSINVNRSMQGRYSEVTVFGQAPGNMLESGRNALSATVKDDGMIGIYRPHMVTDHDAESVAICRDRARKLISDSRLNALTITAAVKGHRIIAPGTAYHGILWKPGQRVRVISEPHHLDAVYFMMGRRFTGSRKEGTRSILTLKEDGVWVAGAHPRKHRHGRNNLPGKIIDIPGPAL